jgi:hypothetical protein
MSKLVFSAPIHAHAHLALREAARALDLNDDSLRQLLWLLNAHPDLTSHARIFENLSAFLRSSIFEREHIAWAREWRSHIPDWLEICDKLGKKQEGISYTTALSEFNFKPINRSRHPLDMKGLERHGAPAALWNVFQSLEHYPPPSNAEIASHAYFMLQGHFFAAGAECRYRLSGLSFYEHYTGDEEKPIAPIRSSSISPSIRELSHQHYAPLLIQFPKSASTLEYANQFVATQFKVQQLSSIEHRQRGRTAVRVIARYFKRYLMVLGGWRPSQNNRFGVTRIEGRDGFENGRRPGFIQSSATDQVFFKVTAPPSDDPELQVSEGRKLFVNRDSDHKNDLRTVEQSGLSPEETLEDVFTLYPPDQLRNQMLKIHRQTLAMAMQAQSFPFNYSTLTTTEIHHVWQTASKSIGTYLSSRSADKRINALAGAALKLMLCFGQPLDMLSKLRVLKRSEMDEISFQISPEDFLPALVIEESNSSDCVTFFVHGICLPAIHPYYKTELDDELEEIDRPYTSYFVLPDLMQAGAELIEIIVREGKLEDKLFDIDGNEFKRAVLALLNRCNVDRITLLRVQKVISDQISGLGNDPCLSWIITADESQSNQPRMFYTRYSVSRINQVFFRATRRIARASGKTIPLQAPPICNAVSTDGCVGARFVIALDELRNLITLIKIELTNPTYSINTINGLIKYSNLYVLYSIIFQSLDSSIRAINSPSILYEAWIGQSDRLEQFVSLSDKDSTVSEKARLVTMTPGLASHFFHLYQHQSQIGKFEGFSLDYHSKKIQKAGPFFFLTKAYELKPVTVTWISEQLHQLSGYQIPANFHRALLRTELLERGASSEIVDAFLGHANNGENPSSQFSSFDYQQYLTEITGFLTKIHSDIGLEPIESQIAIRATDT